MTDYSKLSDEELDKRLAIAEGKRNLGAVMQQAQDYSALTDSELDARLAQAESPTIIEETHPDVSVGDRLIVKNFANSPEATVNYLRKEYPGLEVRYDEPRQKVLMKRPEEAEYRVLDPDLGLLGTLANPREALADIGDVGWDIGSGVATTAATAGAGVAGAAAGGVGAIPAAMAAGAGSSAALEGGRQGIGKLLGIDQDFSGSDIALSGALGAASPLLLGTGAGGKAIAKAAAKDVLPGAANYADELLKTVGKYEGAQRGALQYGTGFVKDQVLPRAGALLTGMDSGVLRSAGQNLGKIDALEREGVTDLVHSTTSNLREALSTAKAQTGQMIGGELDNIGATFKTAEIRKPFEDLLTKLEGQSVRSPLVEEKIAAVKEAMNRYFSVTDGAFPEALDGKTVMAMKQDLAELGQFAALKEGSLTSALAKLSPGEQEVAKAARDAYKVINTQIDSAIPHQSGLRAEYKFLNNLQENLAPYFSTPERAYSLLRNVNGKARKTLYETLQGVDNRFGTTTLDDANLLQLHSVFGNPAAIPNPMSGAAMRSIPLALAGGAAGAELAPDHRALGGGLGLAAGALLGSPAALKMYMRGGNAFGRVMAAPTTQRVGNSAWNAMLDEERQKTRSP